MRALLFTCLALVACNKENPEFCKTHPGEDGCPGMGSNDGGTDGKDIDGTPGDARLDYGSGIWAIKLTDFPSGPKTLTNPVLTNGADCSTEQLWVSLSQPGACFIVATKITISTAVEVSGPRPLVLVATDSIVLSGSLDASSHNSLNGGNLGPASPETGCQNPAAPPQASGSGGGGGAGGSFVTLGGAGAKGDGGNTNGQSPGAATGAPSALRAGCRGQTGAAGGAGGVGGDGGGAVYVLAGNSIDLRTGVINASGAGAQPGTGRGGGGGGGTGGMIVVSAPMILSDSATRLIANGGGGGGGGNGGGIGGDPVTATPGTPAAAGIASGSCLSVGGTGSTTAAGGGGTQGSGNCGGGGGGGGGGYILTSSVPTSGAFSPAPVLL